MGWSWKSSGLVAGCSALVGCLSSPIVEDGTSANGTTGDGTDEGEVEDGIGPTADDLTDDGEDTGPAATNQVDILFVIDNSGSMGEEQASLVSSIVDLVEPLDANGIDYRIGVTTSDNGNPWCSGTTPEGGQLRFTSCRSRQEEFVFNGAMYLDKRDEACLDSCPHDEIEILPTEFGGTTAPRPWLEVTGGVANVNVPVVEALACMLPQGINGCGFEQQLESMHKSVQRSFDTQEASYGFLRSTALPVIIVISDEADCSYNGEYETIFLPDGDRTFWSLPDEGAPTSAVCWNAGVQCSGDQCEPANYDPLGNQVSDDQAVMRPVSRYTERLQELENSAAVSGVDVLFYLIAGVTGNGSVMYADSLDQTFMDDFGIGPGCSSQAGEAVPPVRMRAVADTFAVNGQQSMFSICSPLFGNAMSTIASRILAQVTG